MLAIWQGFNLASQKNSVRLALTVLFLGVVILNAGLSYVAFGLSGDSRPERLDEFRAKIERGEVEVSKEQFLSSISNMKQYAVASDQLVSVFQMLVTLLAAANVLVVLIVVLWLWRTAGKLRPIDKTDR